MKKVMTLTILALLVAGAGSVSVATSSWEGEATGNCGGFNVLEDWVGCLDTQREGFDGYWGGEYDNDMYSKANEYGSVWVVDSADSYWDSDGWELDYHGNWAGSFNESTGKMTGAWWSDNANCTDGELDGDEKGNHCTQ